MPKPKPGRGKKTATSTSTIFFYLPNEQPYGALCQWYPSKIQIPTTSLTFLTSLCTPAASTILSSHSPTLTFTCAEQFHMFSKALYFGDTKTCAQILSTPDPKEQKKLGKRVAGFYEDAWTQVKSRVVEVGNWYKFTQDGRLRGLLLGTGGRELAEASGMDRVWGVGFGVGDAEENRDGWGENRLGRALMRVRGRIGEMVKREEKGEGVFWDWDGGLVGEGLMVVGEAEGEGEEDAGEGGKERTG